MRKVLLIHPGAMGDLIQALPAFARIRTCFGEDKLVLLVGEPFATLAQSWGLFDEIVSFDARTAYHGNWLARARLLAKLVRRLRRDGYDIVATFKAAPVYSLLARCAGAPVRVGLSRGVAGRLLTTPVAVSRDEHQEDTFFRVASALGAAEDAEAAVSWPSDHGGLLTMPSAQRAFLIGIAPGGGNVKGELKTRRWPAARYLELCIRLLAEYPEAHMVLLGAPSDGDVAGSIMRGLPRERVTSLVGRTSIPAARDVINACRVFITNDSGLLHLAGSTTTPVVAIFGPTSPGLICPRRPGIEAIWHPAHLTPCYDLCTGKSRPCVQTCCIERCSVDEVLARASKVLVESLERT